MPIPFHHSSASANRVTWSSCPNSLRDNRVDEIVVFGELNRSEMLSILDIMIGELNEMLAEKGMSLVAEDAVREMLVTEAAAEHMGARPLRRLIERKIEDKLSDIIIRGGRPKKITAAVSDGEIVCE